MYKEMKKNWSLINPFQLNAYQKASIVEVGNKHGDEFPDFADLLFFFGIKNVKVGGKILGSASRSVAHIYLFFPSIKPCFHFYCQHTCVNYYLVQLLMNYFQYSDCNISYSYTYYYK
jgi:hypothetical protein